MMLLVLFVGHQVVLWLFVGRQAVLWLFLSQQAVLWLFVGGQAVLRMQCAVCRSAVLVVPLQETENPKVSQNLLEEMGLV